MFQHCDITYLETFSLNNELVFLILIFKHHKLKKSQFHFPQISRAEFWFENSLNHFHLNNLFQFKCQTS